MRRKIFKRGCSREKNSGNGLTCFRLAEGQEPALAERIGKELKGAALQFGGEVDQDIAAEDEVDAGKWRAVAEIVLAKHDQGSDLLAALRMRHRGG